MEAPAEMFAFAELEYFLSDTVHLDRTVTELVDAGEPFARPAIEQLRGYINRAGHSVHVYLVLLHHRLASRDARIVLDEVSLPVRDLVAIVKRATQLLFVDADVLEDDTAICILHPHH